MKLLLVFKCSDTNKPNTYFMSKEHVLYEHRIPAFFTATIIQWKKLLQPDKYKNVIINSLRFLHEKQRARIYGFVIMPNHIHILWLILPPFKRGEVQRDFLKFVSQNIKLDLKENHPAVLEHFKVKAKDRKYQFWQRNPQSIYCDTDAIFEQKLDYIHANPVQGKWDLAESPQEYFYSSAKFYLENIDVFGFITNYQSE